MSTGTATQPPAAGAAGRQPRSTLARARRRRSLTGVAFTSPVAIIALLLFVIPLGFAFWMSVNDWPLLGDHHFNGLDNYRAIPQNEQFMRAVVFTLIYTVITTAIVFTIGLALALLVAQPRRGVGFFRTAFFLPYVVGTAAAALQWYVLFNDDLGPFTKILTDLHVVGGPVDWLGTPTKATLSVIVMVIWKFIGFQMVVTLVGLQSIDHGLYEAARLDGSSGWQTMRYITLPLLRPTLTLLLILSITGSLLAFDQFYIMTAGGPDNSTITMVFSVTREAFTSFKLGTANAFAMVLMVALVIINLTQLLVLRRGDNQ